MCAHFIPGKRNFILGEVGQPAAVDVCRYFTGVAAKNLSASVKLSLLPEKICKLRERK